MRLSEAMKKTKVLLEEQCESCKNILESLSKGELRVNGLAKWIFQNQLLFTGEARLVAMMNEELYRFPVTKEFFIEEAVLAINRQIIEMERTKEELTIKIEQLKNASAADEEVSA